MDLPDLQVYFTRAGTPIPGDLESEYLAEMTPASRAAISRYRRWQDRQATLLGKILLLRVLLRQDGQTGRRKFQTLQTTQQGKPFIPGGPEFNISHSGEMVVLAVSRNGVVGVDVEHIRAINIADFSQYLPEVSELRGIDDRDRVNRLFFDLWTQKEALLKACGTGLLASSFQLHSVREGTVSYGGADWFVKKLFLGEEYCAHLVTAQPPDTLAVEQVAITDLDMKP